MRFGDLDLYRHVNNKAYLGWIEDARVHYLLDAAQFSAGMEGSHGMMVVHVSIDYLSQIGPFEEVEVLTRCARIGGKSVSLHHLVLVEDRPAATAVTVFASVDLTTGTSRPNDREMVAAITAWEPWPPGR